MIGPATIARGGTMAWGYARSLGILVAVIFVFASVNVPPANASSYESVMNSAGSYRYCTKTTLTGCASAGTVSAGTTLHMNCWIDDSTATGTYSSKRWFHVSTSTGIRAFVHSSRVDKQISAPNCGTHRGISAARWAAMQIGETVPSSAEKVDPLMDRWSGWCYALAWDSYKLSTGATPISGLGSAEATYNAYKSKGKVSTDFSGVNIGSIVFWTFGQYGHAAIFLGQNQIATTGGDGSTFAKNERRALNSYSSSPAGWVSPSNI
jgi:hypothetical protein